MVAAQEPGREARLAELRQRLYRPGASAADLERYVAVRDEAAAAEVPALASPADPASRRRPLPVVGALLGAAALCGGVVALRTAPAEPAPVVRAVETSAASTVPRGQDRTRWTDGRADDGTAPSSTTVEVAVGGGRVLAQRFSGSGAAFLPLITGGAPLDGGLLTVRLQSADRAAVSWRTGWGGSGASSSAAGATGTPEVGRGATGSTSMRYRGAPPGRIEVRAPAGVRWTLVVAFSR